MKGKNRNIFRGKVERFNEWPLLSYLGELGCDREGSRTFLNFEVDVQEDSYVQFQQIPLWNFRTFYMSEQLVFPRI